MQLEERLGYEYDSNPIGWPFRVKVPILECVGSESGVPAKAKLGLFIFYGTRRLMVVDDGSRILCWRFFFLG